MGMTDKEYQSYISLNAVRMTLLHTLNFTANEFGSIVASGRKMLWQNVTLIFDQKIDYLLAKGLQDDIIFPPWVLLNASLGILPDASLDASLCVLTYASSTT